VARNGANGDVTTFTWVIFRAENIFPLLTGSGLKDSDVFEHHPIDLISSTMSTVETDLARVLRQAKRS